MFSGVALIVHILSHVSLQATFVVALLIFVCSFSLILFKKKISGRAQIYHRLWIGTQVSVVALIGYDLSKWLLSQVDPSPFNPFEAIHKFGVLLCASSTNTILIWATGGFFHLINGICFGVSFVFLFEKPGLWSGIFWGCFLEFFQLMLFPDWLGTSFRKEFTVISSLSHIVYGVILGKLSTQWTRH